MGFQGSGEVIPSGEEVTVEQVFVPAQCVPGEDEGAIFRRTGGWMQ